MGSTALSIGASVVGSLLSASGKSSEAKAQIAQGRAQKAAADYQAAQMRVNAGQAEAQAQVASLEQTRQARILQSRALALAAASGGGASDPTVMKVISDIGGQGELARLTALYNGNEVARGLRDQASATEYEGNLSLQASKIAAKSTRMGVLPNLFDIGSTIFGALPSGGFGSSGGGGGMASGVSQGGRK